MRSRPEGRAAVTVDWRTSATLTRAAGVLLLERLLAAAGDFGADLRLVHAAVLARADLLHDPPHEVAAERHAEDLFRKSDLAHLLGREVPKREREGGWLGFFYCAAPRPPPC